MGSKIPLGNRADKHAASEGSRGRPMCVAIDLARFGVIGMRAQAEVPSALRTDSAPVQTGKES
jgi:hypothetical protein